MVSIDRHRREQMRSQRGQARDRVDGHRVDERGFGRILFGHEGALHPTSGGEHHHREQPTHRPDLPREPQFPDEHRVLDIGDDLARGKENARGDREDVGRAFLAQVGRGKRNRDLAPVRPAQATVADGGADPFA